MKDNWTIRAVKGTPPTISVVEWEIRWTDDARPGVETVSAGVSPLSTPLPTSSDKATVVAAVKATLGTQFQVMTAFAENQLAFQYLVANTPATDASFVERLSPTVEGIVAERSRRLALGFSYDFHDARGIHHIGTTPDDMAGWDEVTQVTNAMLATGTPGTINIKTDTGAAAVTPLEWQAILLAAGVARQPIWQASFVLQAMNPIPADFTDDKYWPEI